MGGMNESLYRRGLQPFTTQISLRLTATEFTSLTPKFPQLWTLLSQVQERSNLYQLTGCPLAFYSYGTPVITCYNSHIIIVFVRSGMAKIITHLKKLNEKISDEIEALKENNDFPQKGINLVPYWKNGCEYYRLVSKEPIFKGKNGKMTRTKHLGTNWMYEVQEVKETMKARKRLKILENFFAYAEKTLCELEALED
jgi:hypothetical protein